MYILKNQELPHYFFSFLAIVSCSKEMTQIDYFNLASGVLKNPGLIG